MPHDPCIVQLTTETLDGSEGADKNTTGRLTGSSAEHGPPCSTLFRWKLPSAQGVMEGTNLLCDHGTEAYVRVVRIRRKRSAAEPAVETFEVADDTQVFALPGWEFLLQRVVGDGQAKVTAQSGHRFRLGVAVGANDLERRSMVS
jgi:hypothetical protein